jgi:hypothetical protein
MRRIAALGGGLILIADCVYLWLISQQGASDGTLRAPFVAAYLAACGIAALVGAAVPWTAARMTLLSFSAAGTVVFGVLGIFSIGLLLLVVAVPVVVAAVRCRLQPTARLAAALVGGMAALALIVVGLSATEVPVSCPATGDSGGSGAGFLTGDYSWTCSNGKLTTGTGLVDSGSGSSNSSSVGGPIPPP